MALCSVLELLQEALWVLVSDKILDAPLNLVSQITINNLSMFPNINMGHAYSKKIKCCLFDIHI